MIFILSGMFNPGVHTHERMMVALNTWKTVSNESDKNNILKLLSCSLDIYEPFSEHVHDYLILILCVLQERDGGDALENLYICYKITVGEIVILAICFSQFILLKQTFKEWSLFPWWQ